MQAESRPILPQTTYLLTATVPYHMNSSRCGKPGTATGLLPIPPHPYAYTMSPCIGPTSHMHAQVAQRSHADHSILDKILI